MIFRENDIANSLYLGNEGGNAGSYNHLYPAINPAYAADDYLNFLISVHERTHADLNSISCYGQYLSILALLQFQNSSTVNPVFSAKQRLLLQYCKTTHEVCATYVSVATYLEILKPEKPENPLVDNREYMYYYTLGEKLVGHIPGFYIQSTFIQALCGYCFLSNSITNELLKGVTLFEASKCRSAEFPDERLSFLLKNIHQLDAVGIVEAFLSRPAFAEHGAFLLEDLSGTLFGELILQNEQLNVLRELHIYITDVLCSQFDKYCGESLSFNAARALLPDIIEAVKKEFPEEKETMQWITLRKDEKAIDRSFFLQFENEKIQVWSSKPLCILILSGEVPPQFKNDLFENNAAEAHLMLQLVFTPDLLQQYDFVYPEDKEWLEGADNIMLVVKQATANDDNRPLVYILAFESPESVISFFHEKPALYPIFGMMSLTAFAVCESRDNGWPHFFKSFCWSYCSINDISLLLLLEEDLVYKQGVSYYIIAADVLSTTYSSLVFFIQNDIGNVDYMVVPGSVLFISYAESYISKKYPEFTLIKEEPEFLKEMVQRVLGHIFTEQYMVGFKPGLEAHIFDNNKS